MNGCNLTEAHMIDYLVMLQGILKMYFFKRQGVKHRKKESAHLLVNAQISTKAERLELNKLSSPVASKLHISKEPGFGEEPEMEHSHYKQCLIC